MKIVQIVGYKNSGKTTLTQDLINYFSNKGVKVASLKNHGHGGAPVGIENTDSEKHQRAGSLIAGVIGENRLQLSHLEQWNIEDILTIYQTLKVEVLFLEGFKKLEYPKIVLLKDEKDMRLLEDITSIIAVVTNKKLHIERNDIPIFDKSDSIQVCDWLGHMLEVGKI
ncbi:molybdopterin-guanine dinucleotide biosynthesis protein B [Ornithinibacillus halotolerans]|uniref:Molybdopterin-guanine dinucleotide biosynthesis protein MobB n=1 Tax=Ornithinibacillus halotolerans TaxID=1274357 RepID=A0A916S330_9BACI|nr:molybdopterin-guanine dinucleotide biosynthesis protein B [Ornithinibacillus halotolerans]GGA81002.1 molybdopterin-guanine dinucleotide biosynthesis protein MobB [Ornithinibacillus halotolerans]